MNEDILWLDIPMDNVMSWHVRDWIYDLIEYYNRLLFRDALFVRFDHIHEISTIAEFQDYVNMISRLETVIDAYNIHAWIFIRSYGDFLEDVHFITDRIDNLLTVFLQLWAHNNFYCNILAVLAVDTLVDWCKGTATEFVFFRIFVESVEVADLFHCEV